MRKLKMYVWEGVLCDCTCGLACVLAYSPEEARKVLRAKFEAEGRGYAITEVLGQEPIEVSEPAAFYVTGGG